MRHFEENHLVTPSYLCEADRSRCGGKLIVICSGTVKISTEWKDGSERWTVSRRSASFLSKRWSVVESGSSVHCATAWIAACKAAYEVWSSPGSQDDKIALMNFKPWMERNNVEYLSA